ncbi:MAG: sulfite exporter TauE/SafE family protein [Desulfobulbaceae bacterium]|nr:sulfite exporter TauE/SafE family protein [Desulfobulbaceae bacterium]
MGLYLLIGILGLITGSLSGLLGIGGGIIMAPLLLYVPPLFGFEPLSMKIVAGLTIVQGLAASLAGGWAHRRFRFVSDRLSLFMGVSIFIASLFGGAAARWIPNQVLLFIFAGLAFAAAILMFVPVKNDCERPDIYLLDFSRFRAVVAAAAVGLFGGMVGQGGSFILIPLMTSYVHIPTRIAIGSNLGIVLISCAAGFAGKAITGQIEWLLAIPVVLTVIPAAMVGAHLSNRARVGILRQILAGVIALAAIRIWISLF